jgi:hypothetical protein
MTGGFFVIDRGVWEHPGFANETFTELQAWFWLISNAAWEPCQVRVGKATISLERGQCAFALRFLAAKWRWSEPRVRRFLQRRATDAQVLVSATREATLITICKYNDYQLERRTDVPEIDAGLNQNRRKEEYINKQINNIRADAEKKSRRKPARPMPDIFPVSEAQKAYAEKCGYKFEIGRASPTTKFVLVRRRTCSRRSRTITRRRAACSLTGTRLGGLGWTIRSSGTPSAASLQG